MLQSFLEIFNPNNAGYFESVIPDLQDISSTAN